MTKVALIVSVFPSREHPYIAEWARELRRAGLDLSIYAEQAAGESGAGAELMGRVHTLNSLVSPFSSIRRNFFSSLINLIRIPRAWKILRAAHPGKPLSVLRKLYEYLPLLSERFDVLHFNAPQIAARRFELGRLLGARTLVSFRGQDFSFDAARYRPLLTQADHLHFISGHLVELASEQGYAGDRHTLIPPMAAAAVERNGIPLDETHPAPRLVVERNGIPLDETHPAPRLVVERNGIPLDETHPAPRWKIFSAARFSWTKGWEFALQAVLILTERGRDVEYAIAGDGEMQDAILYTIHVLNLQERVRLLGWLSPDELKAKMQESDLYVLASVEEGFNNSVLQAQACGLPVVCSDAGGLPENIVDGETGLLFQRRDAWDMADKIETLLANPERMARMGEAARKRAPERFSARAGAQAFLKVYENLDGQDK